MFSERNLYEYLKRLTDASEIMAMFHLGYLEDLEGDYLNSLTVTGQQKQYPIVVCPPAVSSVLQDNDEWDLYELNLFFMRTVGSTNSNVIDNNPAHDAWLQMARVARDFFSLMKADTRAGRFGSDFAVSDRGNNGRITKISEYGKDVLSGARIEIAVQIYNGCSPITKFPNIDYSNIVIP